jgi:alkaline phosphatase D
MPFTRRSFSRTIAAAAVAGAARSRVDAQQGGIFRHGVASGDPLVNRVILWTRLTLPADEELVVVEWAIAEDPGMRRIRQRGATSTNAAYDYTVKVDVARLDPGTTYYYQFTAKGTQSPVGRTKTIPVGTTARLRFAVASCSNYPYGFFNAYRLIAGRADLDFVTHLGDYIYEYANTDYGDGRAIGRVPSPDKEIVTVTDYRQRYAQYRTDPDLQEAHRQHPWIVVWDDHESANDSWESGAENHTGATEGDWSARRAAATQAWFEWMPVRENPFLGGQIYRTFSFGNLMDFVMLDTRLSGRSQQVGPTNPALLDPNRTLLGADQEAWFLQELVSSRNRGTRWRFVGQQVMMGQLLSADGAPFNTDQWDGYPVSRARLLNQLTTNQIGNVVVLTGDIHSSWGNEITANPFVPGGYTAQAVEFVTPAITSPGIDDRAQATGLQQQIGATHPHVKYVELFRRGYLLIDLTAERAQAEWYHVRTITERSRDEELGRVLQAASGDSRLRPGDASAAPAAFPMLAP